MSLIYANTLRLMDVSISQRFLNNSKASYQLTFFKADEDLFDQIPRAALTCLVAASADLRRSSYSA